MAQHPKPSRMERQVQNLERYFLLGGMLMLALTMGMAARFGWGLGSDDVGRVGHALFYAGADAIGAALMSAVGLLFAWRWRTAAVIITVATIFCIAFSMASIFGFQSANRTAVTQNYEAAQGRADKRLEWLRNQTMDKGLAKDRQTFIAEEREQFKAMQSSESDPDAQASELAKMLGIKKDQAQRHLNLIGAAFILFLQFVCLSLRSFLRHRVAPVLMSQREMVDGISKFSNGRSGKSEGSWSNHKARSDLTELLAGGFDVTARGSLSFLARRWGWPPNSTNRWLRRQPDISLPVPKRRSVQSVDNRAPALNGNGRAHMA